MHQSNTHSVQKSNLAYVAIAIVGIVSLLLGLYLIIVVGYHERAYVFLGLGAGCFIGGVAGSIETRARFKTALSYGMIALGMMGIVIGINYLVSRYGPAPNHIHATIVLGMSIVAILIGILGAWIVRSRGSIATLASLLTLGIMASIGIVALTIGIVYKFVLNSPVHGYILLSVGIVCLVIGIVGSTLSHNRVRYS